MSKKKTMMVWLLSVILLGLGQSVTFAQMSSDQKSVLEKCLVVAEMQEKDHTGVNGSPVLTFLDNGVISRDESLEWFGNNVDFKTPAEIGADSMNAYIEFEQFDVIDNTAKAAFMYRKKSGPTIRLILEFTRVDSMWCITGNQREDL